MAVLILTEATIRTLQSFSRASNKPASNRYSSTRCAHLKQLISRTTSVPEILFAHAHDEQGRREKEYGNGK
jgi:hypothetical protein